LKFDVVTLGEVLIDFTMCGTSKAGMRLFEQNAGGAVANALCALSRLGKKTAFIGKVGRDMHGDFLRETLSENGIDTSWLYTDDNAFTTLAFVTISDKGERSFSFARKPGADICITAEELPVEALKNTRIFHFGSLSLTDEPARSATFQALKYAREGGAIISYDPNYRQPLWKDEETAVFHMKSPLPLVDLIKISDEETKLLTGEEDPEAAAKALLKQGLKCVAVTLGSKGALLCTKSMTIQEPGLKCKVVDTTGAGDAFWGGFLYSALEKGINPWELDKEQAHACLRFANTVAAICVGKSGGIPAMPVLKEVDEYA